MFVTVWFDVDGKTVGSDEHISLDDPFCDPRELFPGSVAVTVSGDHIRGIYG